MVYNSRNRRLTALEREFAGNIMMWDMCLGKGDNDSTICQRDFSVSDIPLYWLLTLHRTRFSRHFEVVLMNC